MIIIIAIALYFILGSAAWLFITLPSMSGTTKLQKINSLFKVVVFWLPGIIWYAFKSEK